MNKAIKNVWAKCMYLVFVLLITVLFLPAPLAPTVQAKLTRPSFTPKQVVFNAPLGKNSQEFKILHYMERAINSTVKGSTVRISMYSLGDKGSANAIIKAHKRGVNIQYVTDDHMADHPQLERIREALKTPYVKGQDSFVKICDFGCTSDYEFVDDDGVVRRAYNHAKFLLFSSTSKKSDNDTKEVVMITSTNMTGKQAENGWNNLVTVVGDSKIYGFLTAKFDLMVKNKNIKDPYDTETSGAYKVYFYPHIDEKLNDPDSDTVLDILNNVKCTGVAAGYGYKDGSTRKSTVDIVVSQWAKSRVYLAEKLWQLNNDGCSVRVVVLKTHTDSEIVKALTKATKSGRSPIQLRYSDYNKAGTSDSHLELYAHSKYILINGNYNGDSSSKVVFTGTANFTRAALRHNNEVMIRIMKDSVYDSFRSNFNSIFKHSTKYKYVDPN